MPRPEGLSAFGAFILKRQENSPDATLPPRPQPKWASPTSPAGEDDDKVSHHQDNEGRIISTHTAVPFLSLGISSPPVRMARSASLGVAESCRGSSGPWSSNSGGRGKRDDPHLEKPSLKTTEQSAKPSSAAAADKRASSKKGKLSAYQVIPARLCHE